MDGVTGALVYAEGEELKPSEDCTIGVWKFYDSVLFQFKVWTELSIADTAS